MEIIESNRDGCGILIVKGKLDALTSPALREKLLALIDAGARRLLIDGALLDYISSAGLRVLYEAIASLETVSGRMALCAINSNVRKILDTVDLCADIPIFATEAEAILNLNKQRPEGLN